MEEKLKTGKVIVKVTKRRVGEDKPYEVEVTEHEVDVSMLPRRPKRRTEK